MTSLPTERCVVKHVKKKQHVQNGGIYIKPNQDLIHNLTTVSASLVNGILNQSISLEYPDKHWLGHLKKTLCADP